MEVDVPRIFLACLALFLTFGLFQWLAGFVARRTFGSGLKKGDVVTLQKHFVKAAQLLGNKRDKEKAKGAIRELELAAKVDPKDPTVHSLKAIAHEVVGDVNGCLRELDMAIENYRRLPVKDRAQIYAKRAKVLIQWKRKYDDALVDLETSLTLSKKNAGVLALLGQCYEHKRQWTTARDLYQQALKVDRNHAGAREGVERLETKGGDEPWGHVEQEEEEGEEKKKDA